jgi:hypothetical protein
MSTAMPRRDRRALLLASLLQKPDREKQSEGAYDPVKHDRTVSLGKDRGSAVARMVSWHESFHAFLNASTCHGNAMMFAGALAAAGYEGFESLVERMIDVSLITHETYATVSAIAAADRGMINAQLLASYPDYQPLLKSFTDLFPSDAQPVLSVMALAVCARAAMQTPIYETLLARPCEAWPQIDLHSLGKPDERFALLMTSATVGGTIAAMKTVLREAGGQYAAIADESIDRISAQQVWISSATRFLDEISKAGFAVCAEVLLQNTGHACEFNGQKNQLRDIVAKVKAFAGDGLKREFRTADSWKDDEVSVFVDFRNEQLVLSEQPLPARFISLATHPESVADNFVLAADQTRYYQLVAMPPDKARKLYAPIEGEQLLTQATDDLVAGLRRRWEQRVELLVLGPDTAPAVLKRLSNHTAEPYIICSLTLLNHTNWLMTWLQSPDSPANRMSVLIDDDCTDLITRHAERGAELQLAYVKARSGPMQDEYTEVLCFAAGDEPDVIYFTPCSTPFRQAVTEFVRRRFTQFNFDGEFIKPWLTMLKRVIAHTLHEEARFGDRFWT